MLIRIRNAQAVRKETALVPYSRIKMEIAKLLQQEGFVTHALRKGRKTRKSIEITRQGLGTAILSTPKGVLTGISARKEHVGGEVLCEVW
ncbi:MAG: 30S ribosomal protein S8 [Parcubacteria group bacterium]|nr:30S ribosomal protein S8 [Parcubacteria group bacterium]